ncbi:MAG: hypothetical protein M1472_03615 [Planctomycetes bacterium]|jgi:hypothetical protein|nr:hypothetical protein [Planctomycetota bacterium]MDA8378577.1 hypothetical protein [Planctomycetia bacterium]
MKQLKLSQACLLDVSGELGSEARALLREHVETYPDAMLEYDQALAHFKTLQTLPSMASQIDQVTLERMRQQVRQAVRDAVDQQRRTARWRVARRLFYRAMSVAAGMAAVLVVMAGVYIVRTHLQAQQERLMDAESTFQEMAESPLPYRSNTSIRRIRSRIDSLDAHNVFDAQSGVGSAGMMRLFNALDKIPLPGSAEALQQTGNIQ